jgi:peroxiredoxin
VLVLAAMVGLFARSLLESSATVAAELRDGTTPTAPDFTLTRLDGGKASLSDFRGKVVLLNFWASWCPACKEEAAAFNDAQARYAGRGVAVVGVDSQDLIGEGRAFARTYHVRYPLVHDGPGDVAKHWGVTLFPATFVIDRRGKVVKLFDSAVTATDLRTELDRVLGRRA